MKKYAFLFLIVIFALPLVAQNKFVGTNTCACHNLPKQGKQVDTWKKSKHAEAFNVLKSDKAAEYAKAKGIAKASEAKECLECHTTGYGEPAEKSFKMEMGVQCEACHGAASGYKAIHNKPENKEKAIAAGLILDGGEKMCKTCHTPKMHEMKEFDFKKMMEEIKHPMPKG
ncbi:MAG: cytochrome c family protein [Ignavibacteriales bacterium]|nr:cytochrome c family protein [Ignavibacteriales bacterium]